MPILSRSRHRGATTATVLALTATVLAACASPQPKSMVVKKPRSKEYFAETEFGVKASPRVSYRTSNLPRGGGRDQVGKPYKVRGKMYYPREEKGYVKTGLASWYGDAFHGRLTANGEVYDMTHLTAAHPTMPLPSYARVTNIKNGTSIIVRVNDRGPYAHDRLIDLSKRAAEMLDYTHDGTAKVKVEYVGRAPLHGQDDQYLMASYRPGNGAPDPSDALPTGVMIAMNGPTPSVGISAAFPGALTDSAMSVVGSIDLPAVGPVAPERPAVVPVFGTQVAFASLRYAGEGMSGAGDALAKLGAGRMTADEVVASWKRQNPAAAGPLGDFIAAGSFRTEAEAVALAGRLKGFGDVSLDAGSVDGAVWYGVNLVPDAGRSLDEALKGAWAAGAPDALAVRS